MAETTKLAGTFKAWKLVVGVRPENLDGALCRCRELGLLPNVCGYQDGNVLFRVLLPTKLPDTEDTRLIFMKEMAPYHGMTYYGAITSLACPPSGDVIVVSVSKEHPLGV